MDKKEKLLTISIAAYHVEKYLAKCLESFAYRDLEEELEVLVINDGSGDAINAIAMEYVTKYPKIFHLIDKKKRRSWIDSQSWDQRSKRTLF